VVDAIGHKVPVAMAGGVGDGRGLAAALMLGAQGVVLGTRFYASQEAAGHPNAKARLVAASCEDTLRSIVFDVSRENIWPAPYTSRCLLNDHARKWAGREMELVRRIAEERDAFVGARTRGDFDIAPVIAGEVVGLIHDLPSAKDIVERIMAEAGSLMSDTARVGATRTTAA
jgi:nitronate monooxygenase